MDSPNRDDFSRDERGFRMFQLACREWLEFVFAEARAPKIVPALDTPAYQPMLGHMPGRCLTGHYKPKKQRRVTVR